MKCPFGHHEMYGECWAIISLLVGFAAAVIAAAAGFIFWHYGGQ